MVNIIKKVSIYDRKKLFVCLYLTSVFNYDKLTADNNMLIVDKYIPQLWYTFSLKQKKYMSNHRMVFITHILQV